MKKLLQLLSIKSLHLSSLSIPIKRVIPPVKYEVWAVRVVNDTLQKTYLVAKCRTKLAAERAKGYHDIEEIMRESDINHLIWDLTNEDYLIP